MNNINVVNNAGKELNVTVNNTSDGIQIVINLPETKKQLKDLQPGDVFKDKDGEEYILWYFTEDGNAAILKKTEWKVTKFGENNNFLESYICMNLKKNYLPILAERFGAENIVEHEVNLLSLDGLDDYGKITCEVSIPTVLQYMQHRKTIGENLNKLWWLSTPDSTPTGCSAQCVRCVGDGGGVGYGWCGCARAVRPFFILNSLIFVS